MIDINLIRPYEKNPRKNAKAVEVVTASIAQYGFQQPIVVDNDMVIIVGHTRYRAAKALNLNSVPVTIASELTQEQVKAYRIMDNRSNENAHWDDDLLFDELEALLNDSSIQLVSQETGFTESELNRLFKDDDTDVLAELTNINSQSFKSKVGDVWTLGNHRIMNGDSTKEDDINALLQEDLIDLVWEDPPYGVAYQTANGINHSAEYNELKNHKIANDNITPEQLDVFLQAHLNILMPKVRAGASFYWCHDIRFTQQFRDLLANAKVHISDTLIWRKNNASNWLTDYAKYYEPILYGWKEGAEHSWYGKGMQPNAFTLDKLEDKTKEQLIKMIVNMDTNYQEFSKETRKIASLHPTVKPTALIVYHIINSSKVGQIIYDGFSGSGSTLIAAEKTSRKARCIEFEPKFVDVTIRRWQELTGGEAINQDGIKFNEIQDETINTSVVDNMMTMLNLSE